MLHIKTKEGKQYVSDPETMPFPVDAKKIKEKFLEKEMVDFDGKMTTVGGHQLFVSTQDPPDQTNFYLWRWTGVFKIMTIHEPPLIVPPGQCPKYCFMEETNEKEVFVLRDKEVNGIEFTEELTFIERGGLRFTGSPTYSFNLQQYSITEKAYVFWKGVKDQTSTGSITDAVPGPVIGNIRCLDTDEEVLGLFSAMAVSRKNLVFFGKYNAKIIEKKCHEIEGALCDPPPSWPAE